MYSVKVAGKQERNYAREARKRAGMYARKKQGTCQENTQKKLARQ